MCYGKHRLSDVVSVSRQSTVGWITQIPKRHVKPQRMPGPASGIEGAAGAQRREAEFCKEAEGAEDLPCE